MADSSKAKFTDTLRRLLRVSKPELNEQDRKERRAKRPQPQKKSA